MDPRQLFKDSRLTGMCAYCGGAAETRDHVPSRVLIDKPYPPRLPVVEACEDCNHSFSLDEQYLACFIECVICGTTDPEKLQRSTIARILKQNSSLRDRIVASRERNTSEEIIWIPEYERVRNVVLKLSRGHIAYELYPYLEESFQIGFMPIANLNVDARTEFETLTYGNPQGWSEIGTRAFHRELGKSPDGIRFDGDWIIIQPGRYRYAVSEALGPLVRIVLSEYLACEVYWKD